MERFSMDIQLFALTPFAENCYVVSDGDETIIIDPGEAVPELKDAVKDANVTTIVNTHCHIDHCAGNAGMKAFTGAELILPEGELPLLQNMPAQAQMFGVQAEPSPPPDRFIQEGDVVTVGAARFEVYDAPGHSPAHVVLVGEGVVFGGDVLFQGSIGRTDLPGGDMDTLLESIRTKLWPLPDETVVYSGHGPPTTIGQEKRTNPFLQGL
jgi:glyoxylase-like metal-dependent hydrolase (beta-lactamase superfamily II)